MVTEARKKKEQAVCMSVELYLRQGMGKMEAIRPTMHEFNDITEGLVYNIRRRNKKKEDDK